ncbi:MAG: hypothetical protein M9952_04710 [Microthrixaceae bacterium]|nr:hypothetical protein [Microthrixaceae bacterium]
MEVGEGGDEAREAGGDAAAAARWRHAPGWVWRAIPGRVLLAARGGLERTVEGIAVPVWIALSEPATISELVEEFAEVWPDQPPSRDAISEALEVMATHDLVVCDPVAQGPVAKP